MKAGRHAAAGNHTRKGAMRRQAGVILTDLMFMVVIAGALAAFALLWQA